MKASLSLLCLAVLGLSACSSSPPASKESPPTSTQSKAPTTNPEEVGEKFAGFLNGYLDTVPDSLALLPPPPADRSPQAAADVATHRSMIAMLNSPRGKLALQDVELRFPDAVKAFSCSLGVEISEAQTPHLNMLLRRTLTDAAQATRKAKDHYKRARPFTVLKTPTCTPSQEANLATDGSYPSGHTSVGWAWALVLAELAPERSDILLQRGRSFGQSRSVCGVHWATDIEAGRMMGSAVVSKLHANPVFQSQLSAAKVEVAQARARGLTPPAASCQAQADAQQMSVHLAP